eukprot:Sdes_comp20594_c0_seq1m15580
MSEIGLLNRAHGSSRYTIGNTEVIAAVYGPVEVKGFVENPIRATISVVFKPKEGVATYAHKIVENNLKKIFHSCLLTSLHPHTSIGIIVQVIVEDGSIFACAVNAISLALIHAGIPSKSTIVATSIARVQDEFCLRPSKIQEKSSTFILTYARYLQRVENTTSAVLSSGKLTSEQLFEALDLASQDSEEVAENLRKSVNNYYQVLKELV